jgi:hypothetical protein
MTALSISGIVTALALAFFFANVDSKLFHYSETGSVDYAVCLKSNPYFTDRCQPPDKQYIASLIDNIQTDLSYSFSASAETAYAYEYQVTTYLVAKDSSQNGKVLFEDTEELLPAKLISDVGNAFTIHEHVDLDYRKYNQLISAFRADYGLTFDASLSVALSVKLDAASGDFPPIDASKVVSIRIPLSERTINVALDVSELSTQDVLEQHQRHSPIHTVLAIIGATGGSVFVALLLLSFVIYFRHRLSRSDYEKQLDHILHSYNQIIVEVAAMPPLKRKQLLQVNTFDELLDARDTVQKPILYYPESEERCIFLIEDGEVVYVFVLSHASRT